MVIERKETEWVAKAGSSDDGVILNCEANATVRERERSVRGYVGQQQAKSPSGRLTSG